MRLALKNIMPIPLKDYEHNDTSVWNREFSLEFPQKILLNASSGKGKTTFINIIYGLRKDYSGTLLIDDKASNSLTIHDWIELRKTRMSVVFQDLQLFPELSAWDNLTLKNDLTKHKTDVEIENMLALLGILDKKEQLCKTLSLGQQQRLAIIRALLQPFELLLMDEPFSHLDEINTQLALELIAQETDANNAGFILTSLGSRHDFNFDNELKL